jgi:hypothetical protein
MRIQDFIGEISEKVVNNDCDVIFFIGTGFSIWYGYPTWKGLFSNYCTKVFAEEEKHYDFLKELKQKVNEDNYSIPKAFDEVIEKCELKRGHVNIILLI